MLVEGYVVMNTPGNSDGLLRVWIDGGLAFEATGLAFTSADQTVQPYIGYARFSGTRGGGASSTAVPIGGQYRRINRIAYYGGTSF
jgi:hypothetical protein